MNNPKEFWILESRCSMPLRTFYSEEDSFDEIQINDNNIHVIEYSAYEQLQSKLDKACEALERISKTIDCGCNPCRGQCDSVIALKIYIEEIQGCANQALAEIRKKDDNG